MVSWRLLASVKAQKQTQSKTIATKGLFVCRTRELIAQLPSSHRVQEHQVRRCFQPRCLIPSYITIRDGTLRSVLPWWQHFTLTVQEHGQPAAPDLPVLTETPPPVTTATLVEIWWECWCFPPRSDWKKTRWVWRMWFHLSPWITGGSNRSCGDIKATQKKKKKKPHQDRPIAATTRGISDLPGTLPSHVSTTET